MHWLAFFCAAASPQTFHVAIRNVPGGRAPNSICSGSTVFVGCPLSMACDDDLAFLTGFVLGSSSDSDSCFRLDELDFEGMAAVDSLK